MPEFINIAAYKFVPLENLSELKSKLLPFCKSLQLKGTILLSSEGINLFLAGERAQIDAFLEHIATYPELDKLEVKESVSDHQPFTRMLVRLKKEIISMGVEEISPATNTSPKISAQELKGWLDEGRELTLLDVRNDYEVEVGTFENAVPIGIDHFRRFPKATKRLPAEMRTKPLVMFCTGGIRCEKAGPLMEQQGFEQVYQLDGGILKYFEECGGEHYQGDCFVFDKRVAVDPKLQETDDEQCYGCQRILTPEDQQSDKYQPPHRCPYCYQTPEEQMNESIGERQQRLLQVTSPLPGSVPYDNLRPMNVPLKFDRAPLIDFLSVMHANLDREFWQKEIDEGRVTYKEKPLAGNVVIRSGWRINHHVPQTIEPDVSNQIKFLYEDDAIIAVDKPAPLPMHPCGRFNRNSLQYFLKLIYEGEQIRILHRLDAETTGVVLLARKKWAASNIQRQFELGEVKKTYLAKILGHPLRDKFSCHAPIAGGPSAKRGVRVIDEAGLESVTEFEVVERNLDGTTTVKCFPITGRTNQIRLHLQHLGMPIVGDRDYQRNHADGDSVQPDKTESSNSEGPLCLHSMEITFRHPKNNALLTIHAEAPVF